MKNIKTIIVVCCLVIIGGSLIFFINVMENEITSMPSNFVFKNSEMAYSDPIPLALNSSKRNPEMFRFVGNEEFPFKFDVSFKEMSIKKLSYESTAKPLITPPPHEILPLIKPLIVGEPTKDSSTLIPESLKNDNSVVEKPIVPIIKKVSEILISYPEDNISDQVFIERKLNDKILMETITIRNIVTELSNKKEVINSFLSDINKTYSSIPTENIVLGSGEIKGGGIFIKAKMKILEMENYVGYLIYPNYTIEISISGQGDNSNELDKIINSFDLK